MLKNRSKAFAPKFKARRPTPASTPAPSSTRPSVEPQSKTTPGPEIPTEEPTQPGIHNTHVPQNTEQSAVPAIETALRGESGHQPQQIENTTTEDPTTACNTENLKRKSRDKDDTGSAGKRRATSPPSETNVPSPTNPEESLIPQATHEPPTESRIATQETPTASNSTSSRLQAPAGTPSISAVTSEGQDADRNLSPVQATDNSPSCSSSPESEHGPSQFRYPSPENSQAMSAVTLSSIDAARGELPGLGPAGDIDTGATPGQVAQTSQIVPMAGLNPDGSAAPAAEEPASGTEKGKKKKIIRRKKVQAAEAGDDARATVDMQINRARRSGGAKRSGRKKDRKRSTRGETPEGAEDEVIDQAKITMAELCKELKTGKKFSLHNEIKQRIIDEKIKDRLAKLNPELVREDDQPGPVTFDLTGTPQPEEEAPVVSNTGMRMRLVGGQLVVDDSTVVVDRHKDGKEKRMIVQEVIEDDFSRAINFGTYMKRERAMQWDFVSTERFYDGLRQFGTDFESIAKMLPPRTRRQIKLKFNKEEKANPEKITRALIGEKQPIDLDDYEKLTGIKLQDLEEIDAERAKVDQQHAEEDAATAAEHRESEQQKKAEIAANRTAAARALLASVGSDDEESDPSRGRPSGAPAAGTDSAKENEPSRSKSREASAAPKTRKRNAKGKANKRNINSTDGGGEDFQVLGEVAPLSAARYVLDYS